MISLDEMVRRHRVERMELTAWVERRWVRPRTEAEGLLFDEADEARVVLICELRHDLMVNDESMPLVLDLLDQLYAARRALHGIQDTVRGLPEPVRRQLREFLKEE